MHKQVERAVTPQLTNRKVPSATAWCVPGAMAALEGRQGSVARLPNEAGEVRLEWPDGELSPFVAVSRLVHLGLGRIVAL